MTKAEAPTTLSDPVLRLAEYWLSAKVMHEGLHAIREAYDDLGEILRSEDRIDFTTYLSFWLSSLFVVAEGFVTLGLHDPDLDDLIAQHLDSLRLYRNATFHFQIKPDKHVQFHDGTAIRMNWAEALHSSFESFFERHISGITDTA